MKRLYLVLLTISVSASLAGAQEKKPAQAFTLEQCISYALENSINVKNAVIDERIAQAKVKETRGIGLPQVDGSASVLHNSQLPRFFQRYSEGGFSFFPQTEGVQVGDVMAGQNIFQLKSAADASIGVTQLLFNGSYLVGLQAANTYRELSVKTTNQSKEQTIQQVTKAFYAVLVNRDRLVLFDNNIARVDTLLRNTKALFENGFAEKIDVDRVQVTFNNLVAERNKFFDMNAVILQLLKLQMMYPQDQDIEVVGNLSDYPVDENILSTYSAEWDYSKRTDYSIMETNRKLQALDLKNKYAESMPSLAAFAKIGYSTQSADIAGLFKTETNQNADYSPGYGPDKWYPYSNFGLSLNVPIFSGLQRTYKIQQSKLSMEKIENGFKSMEAAIDVEVKQTAIVFLNAIRTVKSQEENRVLAEGVARVTKIKYEQGVGSNIEVIDAETSLREAQTNYYNALYDALVAKVDLDKAYGKLNPANSTEQK